MTKKIEFDTRTYIVRRSAWDREHTPRACRSLFVCHVCHLGLVLGVCALSFGHGIAQSADTVGHSHAISEPAPSGLLPVSGEWLEFDGRGVSVNVREARHLELAFATRCAAYSNYVFGRIATEPLTIRGHYGNTSDRPNAAYRATA